MDGIEDAPAGTTPSAAETVRPAAGTEDRSADGASTPSAETEAVIADQVYYVRMEGLEATAYHASREHFLSFAGKFLTGIQVMLGTAAVAAIVQVLPWGAVSLMIFSALAGVVHLVADPASGARQHQALRARYNHAMAELDDGVTDADGLKRARHALRQIRDESPPAYLAAQAIAYNRAVRALHGPNARREYFFNLTWKQKLFAQVLPMRSVMFRMYEPETSAHD